MPHDLSTTPPIPHRLRTLLFTLLLRVLLAVVFTCSFPSLPAPHHHHHHQHRISTEGGLGLVALPLRLHHHPPSSTFRQQHDGNDENGRHPLTQHQHQHHHHDAHHTLHDKKQNNAARPPLGPSPPPPHRRCLWPQVPQHHPQPLCRTTTRRPAMGCRQPALDEKQRRRPLAPKQRSSRRSSHGNGGRLGGPFFLGARREHSKQR